MIQKVAKYATKYTFILFQTSNVEKCLHFSTINLYNMQIKEKNYAYVFSLYFIFNI